MRLDRILLVVAACLIGHSALASTVTAQIHNAPGWLPSHNYVPATPPTRVNNGAGWDSVGLVWVPYSALAAYQLTSGSCTSAASGGPSGTGSSISDGTCTWKWLSATDYVTITGWANDNAAWSAGTYTYATYVLSDTPLRAYDLVNSTSCSSTIAPTGTNPGTLADGCQWRYDGLISYTSGAGYIPTITFPSGCCASVYHMANDYEAVLWNDQEYVAGSNGENATIVLTDHDTPRADGQSLTGCSYWDGGSTLCHTISIHPATGEGFASNMTPSTPLVGYDATKGVAIRNPNAYTNVEPTALLTSDAFVTTTGIQFKSTHGSGLWMINAGITVGAIIEGGSADANTLHTALSTIAGRNVVANSLIVSHGKFGVTNKYPAVLLYDTIVCPDNSCLAGVITFYQWDFYYTQISNSPLFGFTHNVAYSEASAFGNPFLGQTNFTDVASGDSGSFVEAGNTYTVVTLSSTTFSVSSPPFVAYPGDYRPTGVLVGGGTVVGDFAVFCHENSSHYLCPERTILNFDSPDIIGTTRPQSSRYDVGAFETTGSTPPPGGGSRSLFRRADNDDWPLDHRSAAR